MSRRLAGVLVVTVVLLAVILLAQVDRGIRVPGSAAAEQLPRPPQPGDCLLEKAPAGSGWGHLDVANGTVATVSHALLRLLCLICVRVERYRNPNGTGVRRDSVPRGDQAGPAQVVQSAAGSGGATPTG